jgi:Viral BACON domain
MRRFLLVAMALALALAGGDARAQQCPTTAPTVIAPADDSTVPPGNITLKWSAVPNATRYKVDLFIDDAQFSQILEATEKTITVGMGHFVGWSVTPQADACPDGPPLFAQFSTDCPEAIPVLTAPARGATFSEGQPITFNWPPVPAAESYSILATPDFGQTFRTLASGLTETEFTTTVEAGNWGWTVVADLPNNCPDAVAEPRFFLVGCGDLPVLVSPADGASNVTGPVRFQWEPADGATQYRLYLSIDGGEPFVAETTTNTFAVHEITGDAVFWTVEAVFANNCPPIKPQPFFFTTGDAPDCPTHPGKPAILSPANNATNLASPVKFEWSEVPDATHYRVIFALFNADPIVLGTTEETTLTADVPAGKGFWFVQAFFGEDCPSTISDRAAIEITAGQSCDDKRPAQLISPPNGASVTARVITFDWAAAEDVIGYELYVAAGDSEFELYAKTTETSIERFVPIGRVQWYVNALFAGCPDEQSATFEFNVGEEQTCPTGTITLTGPAENATVTSPVTLSWTGINGAVAYRIWAAVEDGAPVIVARTNALSIEQGFPAGPVTWYAEAILPNACEPIVSAEGHFTVQASTNCGGTTALSLISPAGTKEAPAQVTNPVELKWGTVANTIGYRIWLSVDGAAFEDIVLTKATSITRILPPGVYGWFAEALFSGCPSTQSAVAYFEIAATTPRCSTAAPQIISPAAGSTQTSPVTFAWSAVEDAVKYRVFAQLEGQEPVLLGVTEETELTRPIPPGVITYTIEAVFDECPSTFAPRTTFNVARAQNCTDADAQLVSPANNSSTTAPIEFRWNPVDGAVGYLLVARIGDGSATPVEETTETEVTLRAPAGRLEWWVVTFFRGCDPTESEHFFVDVTRPQECNNRKPLLLQPDGTHQVPTRVTMAWTQTPSATRYRVWLAEGQTEPAIIATTTDTETTIELEPGTYRWFIEAEFPNCPSTESALGEFSVRAPVPCGTPEQPEIQVVGQALSNTGYNVRWSPVPNVDRYELQESTSLDFADAETFTVDSLRRRFRHDVSTTTQYLYRVRGISNCNDERGPYSDIVGVFVIVPQTNMASTEVGATEAVVQKVFLPGSTAPVQFMATADKPWITITPSSGTLPPEGITLLVTANASVLNLGTNTATISVQYTGAGKGAVGSHATVSSVPISISLVTPVTPSGKSSPPPDALIIGAVGHASGVNNSLFESDVRVTNLSAQTMKYQINYTPSGTEGTTSSSSTTIEIPPNGTTALDDVVASVFGQGNVGSSFGMLEIRPLTTSTASTGGFFGELTNLAQQTMASSRTYNFTPTGTFGQFIPAVAFSKFAGIGKILSLQQVAQSTEYRGNFGFLEASGNPVELVARVFDTAGTLLANIPISLRASEHVQYNALLAANGINDLKDGRVEVEVLSGAGKISAYVAEVDNRTNDPLLVTAVEKGSMSTNRWVVPGVAHLDLGFANWVTDMRVFNAGTTDVNATLTFYEQFFPSNNTSREVTIKAGEIKVLDEIVTSLFNLPGKGGSVVLTTQQNAPLTVTARTYNKTAAGTYGQFIPGVTVAESIGAGDRALQVLQVEQSSRFRTNIGLNETTGNPVKVEVALIQSDSIVTPFVTFELQPNEYRQMSVADFGAGESIYNARVTVKVIEGTGKVTAYGASIDRITNDPTYIPAQ